MPPRQKPASRGWSGNSLPMSAQNSNPLLLTTTLIKIPLHSNAVSKNFPCFYIKALAIRGGLGLKFINHNLKP
jgi:hypothetical protein